MCCWRWEPRSACNDGRKQDALLLLAGVHGAAKRSNKAPLALAIMGAGSGHCKPGPHSHRDNLACRRSGDVRHRLRQIRARRSGAFGASDRACGGEHRHRQADIGQRCRAMDRARRWRSACKPCGSGVGARSSDAVCHGADQFRLERDRRRRGHTHRFRAGPEQLGLPVEPLVLAVLFGCNLCYATPVAYQTNMLIMAEANISFAIICGPACRWW